MLRDVVVDVWSMIVRHLSVDDVCRVRETCRDVRDALTGVEWDVAFRFAETVLGDGTFWHRACARPRATSRPLGNWHAETMRVFHFLRLHPGTTVEILFAYWRFILDVEVKCHFRRRKQSVAMTSGLES